MTSFHEHKHGIHATTTLMARSHHRCRQFSAPGPRDVRVQGATVESELRQAHRRGTGAGGEQGRDGQVLQEHLRQAERQGTGAGGEQCQGRQGEQQGRVGPDQPGGNPFFFKI